MSRLRRTARLSQVVAQLSVGDHPPLLDSERGVTHRTHRKVVNASEDDDDQGFQQGFQLAACSTRTPPSADSQAVRVALPWLCPDSHPRRALTSFWPLKPLASCSVRAAGAGASGFDMAGHGGCRADAAHVQ
jgi:hypothetical protein